MTTRPADAPTGQLGTCLLRLLCLLFLLCLHCLLCLLGPSGIGPIAQLKNWASWPNTPPLPSSPPLLTLAIRYRPNCAIEEFGHLAQLCNCRVWPTGQLGELGRAGQGGKGGKGGKGVALDQLGQLDCACSISSVGLRTTGRVVINDVFGLRAACCAAD